MHDSHMSASRTIAAVRSAGASLEIKDGELVLTGRSLLSDAALDQFGVGLRLYGVAAAEA